MMKTRILFCKHLLFLSAHSVIISAAAAEVLTDIFGDNAHYKDSLEREFGVPDLSFTSARPPQSKQPSQGFMKEYITAVLV
jgi:hypothetical protein